MMHKGQLITISVRQALQELKVNKLRTFLSLLGITVGIFCIIAVFTVVDSMKNNIKKEMASLGSDVLYVSRWPWMDEGGEYKWWEFYKRPSMTATELRAVEENVPGVGVATLCVSQGNLAVKHHDEEAEGIAAYAVTHGFDKLQTIEIEEGRYLSNSEIDAGTNTVVIGSEIYQTLFPGSIDALGKYISFQGKRYAVVGVMKKVGQNTAGFDFDNGIIYSYFAAASQIDVKSLNYDPFLMIRPVDGKNVDELKYEVEGALRRVRKVQPGEKNDFAMNQLSQITERLNAVFDIINWVGFFIALFSLVAGGVGIANIMFVTVKERTKIIGLKKAIGATSGSVLMEFLIEAVTLCITGGIIGIITVLLLSLLMTYGLDFPVTLSLQNFTIGIGISATVGILAGYIPARAASKLDPVVAIRSQ